MTVLVTGGAGYVGGHMVLGLVDRAQDLVVVDNLSTGVRPKILDHVPFHVADVGDFETMVAVMRRYRVRSVLHFAARVSVPESVSDPLGYYLENTVKTRALIAACVACGVSNFVFSSTAAVYGDIDQAQVDEETALAPISPYGASKAMAEVMLQDASRAHGLRCAILRYFNVAGADPACRHGQTGLRATHLIKVACQAALGHRTHVDLYGNDYPTADGTCVRDYIHVADLVDVHAATLQSLDANGTNLKLNVGYGTGTSVLSVINSVQAVTGMAFEVRQQPRRPGDPPRLVASVDRLRATLDWQPRFSSLTEIVRHAWDWERKLFAG